MSENQPSEAAMERAKQLVFVGFEGSDPILVISDTGVLCVTFPSLESAEKICGQIRTDLALALDQFAAKVAEDARQSRFQKRLEEFEEMRKRNEAEIEKVRKSLEY